MKKRHVHIVTDFIILHLTIILLNQLLHDEAADRVASVFLTRVRLDDYTTIHRRRVVLLVFRGVVWMDGMANI